MSLISFMRGQGSIVVRFKILDSAATTGAGKTGLTSSSTGLIIGTIADNEATTTAYTQGGSTIESITTLGTFAAPSSNKCRFKEVDATNHKGIYELQLADARYAVSNAKSLLISISGVSGAAETDFVIPLTDFNLYSAAPDVNAKQIGGTNQTGLDFGGTWTATIAGRIDVAISTRNSTTPPTAAANASAVRTELATELGRIDAAISTRMATFSYTVPPTAAAVASATRTELSTELGRIDAAITTRAATGAQMDLVNAPNATALVAIANKVESEIIDETDSEKVLTAITDKIASVNPSLAGLTVAAIASQVRTELATELARIDVATSSRMATFTYTTPPTAAANASAVRTELTTELGRIDASVSSRAPSSTALSNAIWTNVKAGYLDAAVSSASAPTVEEIDAELSANHGNTPWGAAVLYVTPLTVTVGLGEASDMGNLVAYLHGPMPAGPITINDALGSPVNLTGMELTLIGRLTTDHSTLFVLKSEDDQLTVGGVDNNQLTINSGIDYGDVAGQFELFLQNQSDNGRMLAVGGLTVFDAPELPA